MTRLRMHAGSCPIVPRRLRHGNNTAALIKRCHSIVASPITESFAGTEGSSMSQAGRQYEFSAEDNTTIGRLALKMRSVGSWFLLYGLLLVIFFVVKAVPWKGAAVVSPLELVTGLLLLFLGYQTRRGAHAFQSIVSTEGRDVGHLMEALRDLSRFYTTIDRVILVALVLAIFAGIFVSVAH
jgi:hypothetical protein